jgi:hypothetical protein
MSDATVSCDFRIRGHPHVLIQLWEGRTGDKVGDDLLQFGARDFHPVTDLDGPLVGR